jgi:hypothetical protein
MKFNIINFVECIFLYSFDYSINEIAQIKYSNKALAIRKIQHGNLNSKKTINDYLM